MPELTREIIRSDVTPGCCLTLGLAYYVLSRNGNSGAYRNLAQRVVDRHESLRASEGTPEWWYLHRVESIVASYVHNILRHRKHLDDDLAKATRTFELEKQALAEGQSNSVFMRVAYKFGGRLVIPIAIGLLMGVAAFAFAPLVPHAAAESTGKSLPAFAIGTFFGVLTGSIGNFLVRSALQKAYQRLGKLEAAAEELYYKAIDAEFDVHYEQLKVIWLAHTGAEDVPAYDAAHAKMLHQERWALRANRRKLEAIKKENVYKDMWDSFLALFGLGKKPESDEKETETEREAVAPQSTCSSPS